MEVLEMKKIILSVLSLGMVLLPLSAQQNAASDAASGTADANATAASSSAAAGQEQSTNYSPDQINQALNDADLVTLYNYTQQKKTDPSLYNAADIALELYTSIDNNVAAYRNNTIAPQVNDVPKNLMDMVFANPESVLPSVVSSLLGSLPTGSSPYLKVKVLHDWICYNIAYDTADQGSGKSDAQDYASVLKAKKATGTGYSNLMKKMCDLAGIGAKAITGCLKDPDYGFDGKTVQSNHAWNSVFVNGRWQLVDCALDAGYIDGKVWLRHYSTAYLFLAPVPFLYSHLPDEAKYQYSMPTLTSDAFIQEAYIPGKFYQYGLSLPDSKLLLSNTFTNGVFLFTIDQPRNGSVVLSASLQSDGKAVDGASWVTVQGNTATLGFETPGSMPAAPVKAAPSSTKAASTSANSTSPNGAASQNAGDGSATTAPTASSPASSAPSDPPAAGNADPPASGDYTGIVYAMNKNAHNMPGKVDANTFENDWLKRADAFYTNGAISRQELALFKVSFKKSTDNNAYYFLEDPFDTQRNNAVKRICGLLGVGDNAPEEVLSFQISAGAN
jgi:hypothetical protein